MPDFSIAQYGLMYFAVSAFVCAWVAYDTEDGARRLAMALAQALIAPVLVPMTWAIDIVEFLEKYAQIKTFWYFVFDRSQLIKTPKELDEIHAVTLKYRSTGSFHHRMWRLAERCYWKVSKYNPSKQKPNKQ